MKSCSDSEYELLIMKSYFFCKTFQCMNVYAKSSEQGFSLTLKHSGYTGKFFVESIDSSGYGLPITAEVLERKNLHLLRALASNQKQAVFPGQNPFRRNEEAAFMKSIDSSGYGLPSTAEVLERKNFHLLRAVASNQKQAVFPRQNPFRRNEEAAFMKSIDSSGCGLPIICSKHNKEEAHYYVQ